MLPNMPTFLVIGAARSGTTALYNYLRQHPDIFMSPSKEPNFFAFEGETLKCAGPGADYINNSTVTLDAYQKLFAGGIDYLARGEASPLYLYSPKAAARIYNHIPDVKLMAILRNPIDQAFSHFLYAKRQALEPLENFEDALNQQKQRKIANWQPLFQYSNFPRYYDQLTRYYKLFPDSQIKIFLYEDFTEDPQNVLEVIFNFIGVDCSFSLKQFERANVGGLPKNKFLQDFVMRPNVASMLFGRLIPRQIKQRVREAVSNRNLVRPTISDAARAILIGHLENDIRHLEKLIGRDLSAWLS